MLGLLLIYFIGKWHYELAVQFNKNKWLFAILGVVTYYGGTFLFGIGLGVFALITNDMSVLEINDFILGLMALPVGLLCTWGLYKILENNWKKAPVVSDSNELLDNTDL